MATASLTPALPPGFELDPPPPPGFQLDAPAARPAAAPRATGLQVPGAARAEIPVDPTLVAPPGMTPPVDPRQAAAGARMQAENPIAEKVLGAVEGALDIAAKVIGGTVGGLGGAWTAPMRGASMEAGFAEGGAAGVNVARQGLGLLRLGSGEGPRTPTGQAITEGADTVLQNLPAAGGVYGTIAGPAMNAGAAARQVAAPVVQVARQGLDAAGGVVQRGTEAVRGLRPQPAPKAGTPGTPGTPGSAGAAGVDMATQRRERARGLPVPFEGDAALTEGQATRTFEQQRFERETAKDPDMGGRLRDRAAAQNEVALRNLDALESFTGATKAERGAAGQVVVDAVAAKAKRAKDEINQAYTEAREAGDMAEPIDAEPLARWIEDNRSSAGNAGVIGTAEAELVRLGGAQKAGDGSLVPREITINDLEELRKKIVAGGKKDATNAHFAAEINRVIDDATENRGGELYKAARAKFRDYQAEFKERGAIRDLIGIKKGTSDRITATEKVLERAMRSADDLKNVRETLITAGDDGTQAWREMQGQAMRKLRDEVTRGVATDTRGNPIVSPAKLKQTVSNWDADGRLEVLFGKKGAEALRDLSDVSGDLFTSPPGSVNTSNTASVMAKWMADSAASFAATGVPLPLVGLTKAAWKVRSDRKVKKQIDQALGPAEPPAPTTAPPRNPLAGSDTLPPKAPSPAPAPRGTTAAPPAARVSGLTPTKRERQLLRMREDVTDPEVLKDLDRTIEAERKRAEDAARGQVYLRLAEQADDPELRANFEAKAQKLGAVRKPDEPIPAGEATELVVETVEPAGQVGDFGPTPTQMAAWRARHQFGSLDAQAAQDVDLALSYDAAAVERAGQQLERSPEAFRREIARIIEEGKARESQAKPPDRGSEGTAGDQGGERPPGGDGQGPSGGTPLAPVRGGPRAPDGPSGGGSQARPDEGLSREAWEQSQAQRLGLKAGGAGWTQEVGKLGEVIVDFISKPGEPLRAEIRAEYLGKRFASRKAEGEPAIKAAMEEFAANLQRGREKLAAKVVADERGMKANAPPASISPSEPKPSPRFDALAGRVGKIDDQQGLSETERGIEQRFADAVRADPDEFLRRYEQLPDTRGGRVVNTDEARDLWHEYSRDNDARALYAKAVHEPASWIAKAQWDRLISAPPKTGKVMVLGGGGGSGKTSSLDGIQPGFDQLFDAIYDTTLASESKAIKTIEQALQSGRTVEVTFTARDPMDSIVNGIIKRAKVKGRTVPLEVAAEAHVMAPKVLQKLRERFLDDDRVSFRFVDNTGGPGQQRIVQPRDLPQFDYNDLVGRALRAARQAYEEGSISESVFRGLAGEAGREGRAGLPEGAGRSGGADDAGQPASQYPEGSGRGAGGQGRQEVAAVASAPAGRLAAALTDRGTEIKTRYRLMEAADLITSHDDALRPNPGYDQTLQPRDRARQASEDQIARLANDIKPELLGESPKASEGSPIIGSDAQVESGNARTIALRRAYAAGMAKHYRLWLIDHAQDFGLTADQVRKLRQPVLVRQGLGDYDRAQFARDANESSVAEVSATERARSDARTLPDLEGLEFDEAGNVDVSASADWIRAYVQNTVGPSKRGEVMTATGELSQTGNTRIRNAVLMKAYNDPALVERVSESLDPGTKNVLNGLSRAAPDVAKLQDMAAAGAREAPTWVPDLVDAVRRFGDAREEGQTVAQYLAQGSLLGGEATPEVATMMQQIEAFSRAPRRLADHIRALARESMKDPRQGELMEPAAGYGANRRPPPGGGSAQADLDRAWRDLTGSNKLSDYDTPAATQVAGTRDDFVLSREDGKQWAALNVREFRRDDGETVYTAALEVGLEGFPKGTGAATTMYLQALRIAQQRGIGWQSEGVRSDNALAIYDRLRRAGVPFKEDGGASYISGKALSRIDLSAVAESAAKGKPAKLADDLAAQQQFLVQRASAAGFGSLDEFVASDFEGFMRAADEWRQRNPVAELREPLLQAQTPADLKAKADREAAALKADQAEQRRLADKARADAMRDEFTLTGSDRAADNANQGSLFEPKPLPANSPYETDLFGAPVVPPAQRAKPRRGGLQPPAATGGNVGAAAGLSGAPPGEYATRAALVTTRQQQLGHAGQVKTLADAAHALAYLNKSAVERFDALVTDKDGNPLAVIGGFKGALSQASVYPSTLLGEAMQIPGAANLWMSHNHPSGTTALSAADEHLASTIARTFDGTGVKVRGIIAAGSDKWGGATPGHEFMTFDDRVVDRPLQPVQGSSVPAQERQLVESGKLGPAISSPADAKAIVRRLVHANAYRPTIILLDSQNQPVAALPWSVDDAMPLKDNGKLNRLLQAVATSNAGAALIGTGDGRTGGRVLSMAQAQNIGAALARADVRVLDIIDANGGSAAEQGERTSAAVLRSVGAAGAVVALGAVAQNQDEPSDEQ